MRASRILPGMIFLLEDQYKSTSKDGIKYPGHNYIVLGGGDGIRYQCMSVTSLTGKSREREIPILMTNGKVGYIIADQIYTRLEKHFVESNFHGMIEEPKNFIKFLMEWYTDSLGVNTPEKSKELHKKYEKYCTEFFRNEVPGYVEESAPVLKTTDAADTPDASEDSEPLSSGGFRIQIPKEVLAAVANTSAGDEFSTKIPRHPKFWDTEDLQKFVTIMEEHSGDSEFKIQFTGMTNLRSIYQKVYLARKELSKRNATK